MPTSCQSRIDRSIKHVILRSIDPNCDDLTDRSISQSDIFNRSIDLSWSSMFGTCAKTHSVCSKQPNKQTIVSTHEFRTCTFFRGKLSSFVSSIYYLQ